MSLTPSAPAALRIPEIIDRLRQAHPDACCELDHQNPLQLLVATILSAQCTDVRVNQVTPALFARYPTAEALAAAARAELEELVRPTGFYRQKARYIQEASQTILHQHDGQVPAEMDELLSLSGVARKTANVVLGVAYEIAEGIVVDTHVKRLSNRLGLTSETDPVKIERELMVLVPRSDWIDISHLLIFHGRRVCSARRPGCPGCAVRDLCPSAGLV
jgi:endonuclease III